jgi:hypothetical protein
MEIRTYLKRSRLSIKELAVLLGINIKYFYLVMEGKRPLSKRHWEKMVKISKGQVTIEDILKDEIEKKARRIRLKNKGR